MHPFLFEERVLGHWIPTARVVLVLAIAVAFWLLPRWAERLEGMSRGRVRLACLLAVAAALLGGRAHFLWARGLSDETIWLALNPLSGARHAPGAVLGLVLAVPIACRALSLPVRRFMDVGVVVLCVALAIQRLGCFLHGCCFGIECDLPWCVRYPPDSPVVDLQDLENTGRWSLPVHPLPLYFSAAAAAIAAVGYRLQSRKAYDGQVLLVVLFLFSASSAALEPLRHDFPGRAYVHGVPELLWTTIAMTGLAGLALLVAEGIHRARLRDHPWTAPRAGEARAR
jgi:phosphatidylglycerol:prolipoprotein diacylglycerol transferase